MHAQPQKEHQWLQRLVGEWTMEAECSMGPGQPSSKFVGVESVKSLGGLWTIGEGRGEMPGGGESVSIMTLGYDPVRQRYIGTFVAGVMTHLWLYDGTLDAAEQKLTLDTEGPNFGGGPGAMAKYQDIIEFLSDDHRTLTSQTPGPDGQWHVFMTAQYRRKK